MIVDKLTLENVDKYLDETEKNPVLPDKDATVWDASTWVRASRID